MHSVARSQERLRFASHGKGTGIEFSNGSCVEHLAYTDDLCLIARTKEEMSSLLEVVSTFTSWSGLRMNVAMDACP